MKELTTGRGWEYAYKKALEGQLESYRVQLEHAGRGNVEHLTGVIHGIRVAIKELSEVRAEHNLDDDLDMRE